MNLAGARAEELCAELLRAAGLRLLARNWRCRHGEIDLIAEEGGTIVFAEVRSRSGSGFGGAAESITVAKRERLLAAARLYLTGRPSAHCRFDVFLVDGSGAAQDLAANDNNRIHFQLVLRCSELKA